MPSLIVTVRFHAGRYHGQPEWPPSPARLFQALIAGAAQGENLAEDDRETLGWLETLGPPTIAAPPKCQGQFLNNYVPNNDLDAVGGCPRRVGEIRAPKPIRPILFNAGTPLFYVWEFNEDPSASTNARRLGAVAERLYQLGRGVDMAWASCEVVGKDAASTCLGSYGGAVYRPGVTGSDITLAVPLPGSLRSLIERHCKARTRLQTVYKPRPTKHDPGGSEAIGQIFVKPPEPVFRQVAYSSPSKLLFFDLVGTITSQPPDRIIQLTTLVRDAAEQRLKRVSKLEKAAEIRSVIVGRLDSNEGDKSARLRITPIPSIGHPHADQNIRRVLVEVPSNCPLRADDLEWAFSVVWCVNGEGEILGELAPASERSMLLHYGIDGAAPARLWRTITPAALPNDAGRRRIDPARIRERAEQKGADERLQEEHRAAAAVCQALRHAGVNAPVEAIRVQREPFSMKGQRAENFAVSPRFPKGRLWHVELRFATDVLGPLVIGDGRFLGLGLMAPVAETRSGIVLFSLGPDWRGTIDDAPELLRAVRRALMSLAQEGNRAVAKMFSGHSNGGGPAASGRHEHIFLAAADLDNDGKIDRLIVAAPWGCDRSISADATDISLFYRVISNLQIVRAGRLGVIHLARQSPQPGDSALLGRSCAWESVTPYLSTRRIQRGKTPAETAKRDIVAECNRRGLRNPDVQLLGLTVLAEGYVSGRFRLRFHLPIEGPILLGQDSHRGGGLFRAIS